MIRIYDDGLPEDWEEEELRGVTSRKRGYSWSKEDEADRPDGTTVPVLRIPNIQQRLDLANLLHIRNVSEQALKDSAVTKGWTLFVGSNGNPDRIGDSALMTVDRPMVFASFLMGIAPRNPETLMPEFLALWLRLHNVHQAFSKTSQQTTGLANFSWSAVKKLPVRFPKDSGEQKAITQVVETAESLLAASEAKLAAARRLKTGLMQQLFTCGVPGLHTEMKPARALRFEFVVPQKWDVSPLAKSLALVEYGSNAPSNDTMHGLPIVAIPEVIASRFQLGTCSYSEVSQGEAEALRLQPDDVLLIRTNGNSEYIGKSTVIGGEARDRHIIFASYLIRLRTRKDVVLGRYLNYFLASPLGRRLCLAMANTSAGNHNLGARAIRHFCFPRPSVEEQETIVQLVDSAEDDIDAIQEEIKQVEQLKRAVLRNLLTGKVRVRV